MMDQERQKGKNQEINKLIDEKESSATKRKIKGNMYEKEIDKKET